MPPQSYVTSYGTTVVLMESMIHDMNGADNISQSCMVGPDLVTTSTCISAQHTAHRSSTPAADPRRRKTADKDLERLWTKRIVPLLALVFVQPLELPTNCSGWTAACTDFTASFKFNR